MMSVTANLVFPEDFKKNFTYKTDYIFFSIIGFGIIYCFIGYIFNTIFWVKMKIEILEQVAQNVLVMG